MDPEMHPRDRAIEQPRTPLDVPVADDEQERVVAAEGSRLRVEATAGGSATGKRTMGAVYSPSISEETSSTIWNQA